MKILSLILLSIVLMAGASAEAATNESNDVGGDVVTRVPSSLPGTRNGVSRKHYPGGADEDDLQVQATLPIPSRTFDGAAANASVESGAAESAPSPTSD